MQQRIEQTEFLVSTSILRDARNSTRPAVTAVACFASCFLCVWRHSQSQSAWPTMLFTLQCGCMGPTMSFRHGAQRAWVIGCIDPAGLVWVQFHLVCLGTWGFDPQIIQSWSFSAGKSMVWRTQISFNTPMAINCG